MKKYISGVVSVLAMLAVLLIAPGLTKAASISMGNDSAERPNLDTYANFSVVDTNKSANLTGNLTSFGYYASSTIPFRFLLVDTDNKVRWISDQITPAVGSKTYPVSGVAVAKDWNLGLYFPGTSSIPYASEGASAGWTANNSGIPTVGSTLTYASSGARAYSVAASGTETQASVTVPQITSPVNNASTTSAAVTLIDWTDATGTAPITYQLQYSNNNSFSPATTTDVSVSQLAVSNWANGVYYLRVRAKDGNTNYSAWSDTVRVAVGITSGTTDDNDSIANVLAKKAACMKSNWATGNQGQTGVFKNQGQCVAYYNQKILGHVENLIKMIKNLQTQLQVEVKKQNDIAISKGYTNWGAYVKSQKQNKTNNGKDK